MLWPICDRWITSSRGKEGAFHTIERQEGAKAGGLLASHLSKSIPRILASVKLTQQEGGRKVGPVKFLKQWKLIEAP